MKMISRVFWRSYMGPQMFKAPGYDQYITRRTFTSIKTKMSQLLEVKSEIAMTLQPPQTMVDLAGVVYEQQSIRREIQDALTKFNYESITRSEFGQLAGMNQDEIKYLDMFWDPAFNSGWLYLSDDIIKSQLSNEKGNNTVNHFNTRVLLAGNSKQI